MKILDNGVLRDATSEEIAETEARIAASTPTPEEEASRLVKHYDGIVQKRLDEGAKSLGYGDPNRPEVSAILHAISYADEPAIVKYQAEGRLFRSCRSKTWATAAEILNAVQAGTRSIPTEGDLLAELDAAVPLPTIADVNAEIARLTGSTA